MMAQFVAAIVLGFASGVFSLQAKQTFNTSRDNLMSSHYDPVGGGSIPFDKAVQYEGPVEGMREAEMESLGATQGTEYANKVWSAVKTGIEEGDRIIAALEAQAVVERENRETEEVVLLNQAKALVVDEHIGMVKMKKQELARQMNITAEKEGEVVAVTAVLEEWKDKKMTEVGIANVEMKESFKAAQLNAITAGDLKLQELESESAKIRKGIEEEVKQVKAISAPLVAKSEAIEEAQKKTTSEHNKNMKEVKASIREAQSKINVLIAQNGEYQTSASSANEEADSYENNLESKKKEVIQEQENVDAAKKSLKEAEARLEEQNNRMKELQDFVAVVTDDKRYNQLVASTKSLQAEQARIQQQIATVKASTAMQTYYKAQKDLASIKNQATQQEEATARKIQETLEYKDPGIESNKAKMATLTAEIMDIEEKHNFNVAKNGEAEQSIASKNARASAVSAEAKENRNKAKAATGAYTRHTTDIQSLVDDRKKTSSSITLIKSQLADVQVSLSNEKVKSKEKCKAKFEQGAKTICMKADAIESQFAASDSCKVAPGAPPVCPITCCVPENGHYKYNKACPSQMCTKEDGESSAAITVPDGAKPPAGVSCQEPPVFECATAPQTKKLFSAFECKKYEFSVNNAQTDDLHVCDSVKSFPVSPGSDFAAVKAARVQCNFARKKAENPDC